uniref:Uncharacterized protein n=1 Tax=Steinernema glaseri TaxID=37863 RepID=A0A1I7ZRF8_9BILA
MEFHEPHSFVQGGRERGSCEYQGKNKQQNTIAAEQFQGRCPQAEGPDTHLDFYEHCIENKAKREYDELRKQHGPQDFVSHEVGDILAFGVHDINAEDRLKSRECFSN